jgi:hypothetical protein
MSSFILRQEFVRQLSYTGIIYVGRSDKTPDNSIKQKVRNQS